ncbi:MAG TPA: glycosyltransferase family 87 protein [Caulobacteraceae bacterium]|nr:glycosyltransferase family 87 protein [Caulobacteraceae bacterium]
MLAPALKTRINFLILALFAGMAGIETGKLVAFQPLGADFLPIWTAARMAWTEPGHVYDARLVTAAQGWLLPNLAWPRPFPYPPTALALLAPFGSLGFWPALGAWLAGSLALFLAAGRRLATAAPRLSLAMMAFAPPTVLALLVGQTGLVVGGLAILGVAGAKARPRFAGAALGLAAALKPQMLLLAPVALIAAGAGEALVAAALTGVVVVGLSLVAFGPGLWRAWWTALPSFEAEIRAVPDMAAGVIAPAGLAADLGLAEPLALAIRVLAGLAALTLVWLAFRRPVDIALRAGALLCGALMIAPYAMHYDACVLAPVAVVRLNAEAPDDRAWLIRLFALLAVSAATAPHLGAAAVLAFATLTALELWPRRATAEARAAMA